MSPERIKQAESNVEQWWRADILPLVHPSKHASAMGMLAVSFLRHREPHRGHHNMVHIYEFLDELQPYRERADYVPMFIGGLLHDLFYDIGPNPRNETRSALAAGMLMRGLRIDCSDIAVAAIQTTEKHQPRTETEAIFCSIDMAIVGASEARYDEYAAGIEKEYTSVVPLEAYLPGRIQFLSAYASRPLTDPIFPHPDFRHREVAARQNMTRELLQLQARI